MFHVHPVATLDLPELAPYRTLRRSADHALERIFVAEGSKVVRRLLESNFTVVSALMLDRWLEEFTPLLEARPEQVPIYIATKERLETLVGFSLFQGVLALGRFPEPLPLETILQRAPQPRLLVALDSLANVDNLGAIVRNCAAFGVSALVVGENSSSPYLRRAVRNSMGTIFKLPIIEPPSLVQTLLELRRRGIRCFAAHGHAQGRTLGRCELTGDCCIVLGNEGQGLTDEVLAACDEAIAIPMASGVDSLNVVTAGSIFLYEACRQRGLM